MTRPLDKALAAACEALALARPVRVVRLSARDRERAAAATGAEPSAVYGAYRGAPEVAPGVRAHEIALADPASATIANVTRLAHELVHAAQAEREGFERFPIAYATATMIASANGEHGYWQNAFEVEARERAPEIAATVAARLEAS